MSSVTHNVWYNICGMEYVFLGLGNPAGYEGTRHNVGKDFVEGLVRRQGCAWQHIGVARFACLLIGPHAITCVVSDGYMNNTGTDMADILEELEPSRLVVVHDDIDFPAGTVRLSRKKSAGGHKGVASVAAIMRTNAFLRLRIGIGRGENVAQYVLDPILENDMNIITAALIAALPDIFEQLFQDTISYTDLPVQS